MRLRNALAVCALLVVTLAAVAQTRSPLPPPPPVPLPTPAKAAPPTAGSAATTDMSVGQILELARQKHQEALKSRATETGKLLLRDAMKLIDSALERERDNIEGNLLAGEVLMDSNQYDMARDRFLSVLKVEPRNYRANLGYGKILNANRMWRQATPYLEKADGVATDKQQLLDAKRALATAYAGMGKFTEAIDKMDETIKIDPADLDSLETAVEIRTIAAQTDRRQMDGAVKAADEYVQRCKDALEQEPWSRERVERLDRAYDLNQGALRELQLTFYERNLRNEPTDRLLRGMETQAAAALDRLAERLRERALLQVALADHQALILAEQAVQYDPRNVKYLENLAALYQAIRYREKAVETCRKILELDPNHERARQYLASVNEPLTTQPAPSTQPAPTTQSDASGAP
jgi:tetratricopeptide (TPR) repeat protein